MPHQIALREDATENMGIFWPKTWKTINLGNDLKFIVVENQGKNKQNKQQPLSSSFRKLEECQTEINNLIEIPTEIKKFNSNPSKSSINTLNDTKKVYFLGSFNMVRTLVFQNTKTANTGFDPKESIEIIWNWLNLERNQMTNSLCVLHFCFNLHSH